MRKLFNFSNHVITGIWAALFGLTLYCVWVHSDLAIGDNWTYGQSTTMLTSGWLMAVIAIAIACYAFPKVSAGFHLVFVAHQVRTASILFGVVVIGQIIFIAFVHPVTGFDAGMLHWAATSAKMAAEPDTRGYFSLNQNNLPIMLVMHWLSVETGWSSWAFFDYVTMILTDLSALLNMLVVYLFNKKALGASIYLQAAWLGLFPWILIPYSDTWVLPEVSLLFLGYIVIQKTSHLWLKGICGLLLGIDTVVIYFNKPSSFIPLIAMIIVECLWWLVTKHKVTKRGIVSILVISGLFIGGAAGTYKTVKSKVAAQTWIQVDASRNIPAIHFMAMGVYAQGGYMWQQATAMSWLPTKQQKTDYSIKMLTKKLKQRGAWGYFKFLMYKQGNNTANGTFDWLKEGHFWMENQKPKERNFSELLKNFIFLYGRNVEDYRFAAQVWWVTLLGFIAIMAVGPRRKDTQMFRVALVGGFVFLLMFEGGRSRYMIQFLPILLIQSSLCAGPAIRRVRSWFAWGSDQLLAHHEQA